jgi:YVTN family beta-propeller protein
MLVARLLRTAATVASLACACLAAQAQTVGTRIPVGTNPTQIAINPVTNKIYVANSGSDSVTVINATTGATITVPVNDNPRWIGINAETNRIYVSHLTAANTAIIDGATDTVTKTILSGGGGWTAVNPIKDTTYVVRFGTADEVNVLEGDLLRLTFASRSYQPVAIAVNPTNNRVYLANQATTDISSNDLTTPVFYPPLLCPDGSGGFRPQPPDPPAPYSLACIDVANPPVSVAVNPVSNRIYALSGSPTDSISVISGANHTFTSLTPPIAGTARTIAVNPVTNTIYAAYSTALVVVDGVTNAMTVIPVLGGPMAIGVNVLTNMVYVPNADGTMLVLNASTGATSTISITTGANGIAVNPLTNMVYVLDSGGGVTPVTGAAGTPTSTGITATIQPLPGNTGGTSGSINITASSTMTPAPLNQARRVFYRIGTSGPWQEATGTGPYPATYSGLAPGTYTLQAFATNGLEAPSINTDLANVPVVGNIASYTFTVSTTTNNNPPRLGNLSTRGHVQTGNNVMISGFVIGGSATKTVAVVATGPSLANFGITNPLANPTMTLVRSSDQAVVGSNDDWQAASNASQLQAAGFAPSDALESAILVNLPPGAYTAIVQGVGGGTGTAVVAVYEVDEPTRRLVNISTRANVLTGNDVLIGGFVIQGSGPQTVAIVGTGPSLAAYGIANPLANPTLTLMRSSDQAMLATNDDWGSASNASQISASGFAPSNALESAILVTLQPGAYTAILSGVGNTTGIGVVAVYAVQ